MGSDYFAVHAHSEWSSLDGMGTVHEMVAAVESMGQPALALTDHGLMSGCIRLYKECRKAGIEPFPGSEFYLVTNVDDPDARKERYHLGMLALDATGFRALIRLSSRSHQRDRYHRKPLIDFSDLAALSAEAGDHVAVTTGCYFGLVQQMLVNQGYDVALNATKMLAGLFPHTFVELQHHHTVHAEQAGPGTRITDDLIVGELRRIALEVGLPVVAGQDSHYCEEHHKYAHDMMKDICYFGDGEDNRFPGDSYHLADAAWMADHYIPEVWAEIEAGHEHLLELNRLRLPELDKYKFHVPEITPQPMAVLGMRVGEALDRMFGHGTIDKAYSDRAAAELDVIEKMGMGNYFLLVQDVTDWCRDNGIIINARGSANGSLVCYLLGITNVDPIRWRTSFDRFLSLDRKKPPDIDLDIESGRRDEVVRYVMTRWPSATHLGTFSRIGINTQKTDDGLGEDKGSIFVQYQAAMRRKLGKNFDGSITHEDRLALNALADVSARKAPGCHAAGIVLPGEGLAVNDYLATMLIPSSKTTVTQAVMEDVEDAGYVKLDLLGLKALSTISQTMVMLGKDPNDFSWIPWDDRRTIGALRSGKTMGVFQYEGYSTLKGAKQMRLQDIDDVIFCLALYRPAMMDSGMTDVYLHHRESKTRMTLHPLVDHLLDETWGVPVFQEQVIDMMRVFLDYEDLNEIIKAVKASNDKIAQYAQGTFDRVWPVFLDNAKLQGLSDVEAQTIWDTIRKFTDYGFNRAHATAYGHMAYRAAYLKTHYPLEFMAATLNVWAGSPKERQYTTEARRLGITTVRADVALSDVGWAKHPHRQNALLRGLLSVPGVGLAAAETIVAERDLNGPFADLDDMIARCPARPVTGGKEWAKKGELVGVYRALREANALRTLGVSA